MDALTELPGVGRKTANVVLGHALGVPGLPVDRHVLRVANRIGIAEGDDPEKVEEQLCRRSQGAMDPDLRHTDPARPAICHPKPLCAECVVQDDCDYFHAVVQRLARPDPPGQTESQTEASRPQAMNRAAFERHVSDALATIPKRFRDAMRNIAIVVEDEPSLTLLGEMEIAPPDTLFGLYQGVPLTERRWDYGNSLPDRIVLFQGPHEREARDDDDLVGVDRRDAHSRDRSLLRAERRGNRGDRRRTGTPTMTTDRNRTHRPAKKRFGQHFLERAWAEKVVRSIAPAPDQTFFEIGPGRAAITGLLASTAREVVAFEIDRDLAEALRRDGPANVRVVEGDFLTITPERLRLELAALDRAPTSIRVAGNLPYNVASPILFKLVELHARGHSARRCDRDAATRGGHPPAGVTGQQGLRRADDSHRSSRKC